MTDKAEEKFHFATAPLPHTHSLLKNIDFNRALGMARGQFELVVKIPQNNLTVNFFHNFWDANLICSLDYKVLSDFFTFS